MTASIYRVMVILHENRRKEARSFLVVVTENYVHVVKTESK